MRTFAESLLIAVAICFGIVIGVLIMISLLEKVML